MLDLVELAAFFFDFLPHFQLAQDYLFAFNGVEIEIPVKAITGVLGISTFGYSKGNKISSDNLFDGDAWTPWSPTGDKTTTFGGNIMFDAYGSIEIGLGKGVGVGVAVDAGFVLNSDPKGDGNVGSNAQDFQLLIRVTGGPYISLLDGQFSFDLSPYASMTGTLHSEFWDATKYLFAAQIKCDLAYGDFFKSVPLVPSIVGDVVNAMMPFRILNIDFYIDQSDWGVRVIMGVGSTSGNPLKLLDDIVPGMNLYSDILKNIPGVSNIPALKGGFGLSGKMSGNGMPVKITFYDGNDKVRVVARS
jgi:hypothetical protein